MYVIHVFLLDGDTQQQNVPAMERNAFLATVIRHANIVLWDTWSFVQMDRGNKSRALESVVHWNRICPGIPIACRY